MSLVTCQSEGLQYYMIEDIVKNCVTNAGIYPRQDRLIDIGRLKVQRRNIDELPLEVCSDD